MAGVDLTRFKPHSIRAASTSAASQVIVSLGTILRTAGWSSQCTFAQYYQKEVHKQGLAYMVFKTDKQVCNLTPKSFLSGLDTP